MKKVYKRSSLGASNPNVFIQVRVPNDDMLEAINETNAKLKKRVEVLDLADSCDLSVNSSMRSAIYSFYMENNSELSTCWASIQKRQVAINAMLPHFALFKSDRLNSSKDTEVSEPVKYAIQSSVKQLTTEIEPVIAKVTGQIQDILNRANGMLAESFGDGMPTFTVDVEDELTKAFSANLYDAKGISLEKQGSGVRRLYMFNLLISEAKRKAQEENRSTIVYGIEEPETSQHPNFQEKLMSSLKELASDNQIILTTHNSNLLSQFNKDSIRVIREAHPKVISCNEPGVLTDVVEQLGLLPDPLPNAKFKAVLIVEGPTDVEVIKKLRESHSDFDELLKDVWVVSGGGDTIKDWARSKHFCEKNVPQFFLVDSDYTSEGAIGGTRKNLERVLAEIGRSDIQHILPLKRREIEQYVHFDAIKRCLEGQGINTAGLDAVVLADLDNKLIPAKQTYKKIAEHRSSAVPFSVLHEQGLSIQEQLSRGQSLLNDGYKKMATGVFFNEMTLKEITERFAYVDDNEETRCELTDWINTMSRVMRDVG